MDAGQILTHIFNTIDGYSEDVQEIVDDLFALQVLSDATLKVKRELKKPIAEKTVTITSGERGFNLPSDWYAWQDEINNMRLDPSSNSSEGSVIVIVNDYNLVA